MASFYHHPEFAEAAQTGKFDYWKKANKWQLCELVQEWEGMKSFREMFQNVTLSGMLRSQFTVSVQSEK